MSILPIVQITLLVLWMRRQRSVRPVAVLLAMALMGLGILVWLVPGDHQPLMPVLGPLMIAPGLLVGVLFWRRPVSLELCAPPVRCEHCHSNAEPRVPLRLYRVTGLLVWMQLHEDTRYICRSCIGRSAGKATAHNLALGWWWHISGLATPGLVALNLLMAVRARTGGARDFDEQIAHVLAEHSDYIDALVATKDEDTVTEVISEKTGVSEEAVRRYLRNRIAAKLPHAAARKPA